MELKNPMNDVSNSSDEAYLQHIKELEKELRYAKMEIEYLKGLRRLGKKVPMNKKQNSFTISKKIQTQRNLRDYKVS